MAGISEQEVVRGLLDQQIPEHLDGWHGQGLSDLAQLIEYDPRLEGHALGAIGPSDRPAVPAEDVKEVARGR